MKLKSILLIFLFLLPITVSAESKWDDLNDIRVGVFQNKPVTYHEDGDAKGLYPSIIEHIAQEEGWNIEWVFCGFAECLSLMEDNKIDIMTSIVNTPERQEFVEFSQVPMWDYYGIIFSYDPSITGLFDLEGKIIGARSRSVYTTELVKLLKSFEINVEFKPYSDYDKVFEDLNANMIDAAAVNNTFSYTKRDLGHIYQTPIVYSPFQSVWGVPLGSVHAPKLKIIDEYVSDIKLDKSSIYYQFKEHWFAKTSRYWTAAKLFLFIGFPMIIVAILMILYHYYKTIMMNVTLRRNVDDRTKAEDEADKQRMFSQAVVDSLPGIFFVYDTDGKLIQWNKNHMLLTGYNADEMQSMDIFDWYDDDDEWKYIQDEFAKLLASSPGTTVETESVMLKYKDGSKVPYRYVATLFEWDGRKLVIGVGFDTSEMIQTTKEREKLKTRLQQAQKMEAIGTLAGGIAHDFNNILTVILGYIELVTEDIHVFVKESPDDAYVKRAKTSIKNLTVALAAADKAKNLIQQILTFSRQSSVTKESMDVSDVIIKALSMIRQTIPTTIDIKTDIDKSVGNIFVDPTQFQQIIMNLCINSFHAMEETGGILSVSAHRVVLTTDDLLYETGVTAGEFAKISIRDTGCGIPKTIQDKIFNPYFTTKGVDKGTGMGLSIVHGIIKQSKGFVHLYSEVGEGAVFNIFIPIYDGKPVAKIDDTNVKLTGTEHLLLVDDEELIVNVNKMLLEHFGYEVTIMIDSVAALNTISKDPHKFDLVITDQTMPTLTGYELSTKILDIRSDMPIILCSGYSSIVSDETIRESGIKAFALKPILKNDLAKLIRKVLDNGTGQR